jgi:hypothetical protein
MRLDLKYFKNKIIEASALGKLSGNDVLKNTLEILKLRSQSSPSSWLY